MQVVLGSHGAKNIAELVDNKLKAYQLMRARMSLKMHFLHSRLVWAVFAMIMEKDFIEIYK